MESSLALTFLDIANTSRNAVTARRNRENARTAYDAIIQFLPKVILTIVERQEIEKTLQSLKARMKAAGEQF